jgi:hypothetical protein
MKQHHRRLTLILLAFMISFLAGSGVTVEAATGHAAWQGPSDGGGWNRFMQVIMHQDFQLKMSNGNPYWNTLMVPVASSSISSGMSSYMGLPAFGFCPVEGQCYMVLVQRPLPYESMACPPVAPAVPVQTGPSQQGKPTSLW